MLNGVRFNLLYAINTKYPLNPQNLKKLNLNFNTILRPTLIQTFTQSQSLFPFLSQSNKFPLNIIYQLFLPNPFPFIISDSKSQIPFPSSFFIPNPNSTKFPLFNPLKIFPFILFSNFKS